MEEEYNKIVDNPIMEDSQEHINDEDNMADSGMMDSRKQKEKIK